MLAARDLSFAHDARVLLDSASVTLDDDDRCALVGRNGAGKSTLIAILAGALAPDAGNVERGRGQTVAVLAQTPQLDEDATVRASVERPGLDAHRVDEVLTRLGVLDWHKRVRELSGGQRRRVDLARTLLQDAAILLLDEPTNHLDQGGIDFLADELRAHHGPILFVSHDRAFIDEVGTRVVELTAGKLVTHPLPGPGSVGLYDAYLESKLLREDIEAKTQHRQSRLYVRELAWLRAGTPARTTKQRARIERAEQLAVDVEDQARALREQRARVQVTQAEAARLGKQILVFDKCALARGSAGSERPVVAPFDLAITAGSRWGVVGENGPGKTTLLLAVRTACGDDSLAANEKVVPSSGTLTVGKNTRVAVFDQMKGSLDEDETLEQILGAGNDHVIIPAPDGTIAERIHVATYLEQFLFDGADRYRRAKTLSGGQKSRLVLARMFQQGANVLLLDEPTNDLDVETLGVLEDALLAHKGCALIVSHDRRFLDRVVTGILAFEPVSPGVHVPVPYVGDHTHYLRVRRTATAASAAPVSAPTSDAPATSSAAKAKRKRSYKEEQELGGMEAKILALETRRDEVRAILNDGAVFRTDAAKGRALTEELTTLDAAIETSYARWSELDALLPM
jgi:ATP-binding cassette subfamily F protein uup